MLQWKGPTLNVSLDCECFKNTQHTHMHLRKFSEQNRILVLGRIGRMILDVRTVLQGDSAVKDQFLGLAGYCRRFIPNFSDVTSLMTDLSKKGTPDSFQ